MCSLITFGEMFFKSEYISDICVIDTVTFGLESVIASICGGHLMKGGSRKFNKADGERDIDELFRWWTPARSQKIVSDQSHLSTLVYKSFRLALQNYRNNVIPT